MKKITKTKRNGDDIKKGKKRKIEDDFEYNLESEYESTLVPQKKTKSLLPIKTSFSIIPQEVDLDDRVSLDGENDSEEEKNDEKVDDKLIEVVTQTKLLSTHKNLIRDKKIHIGSLCSAVLEDPDEKVTNLRTILKFMDDDDSEVYSVRILATISLLEVFKDIIPSYEIKPLIKDDTVKLKKQTLGLKKFEENLLVYYKKYLQKLEKNASILYKKKGKKHSQEEIKLGKVSLKSLSELLVSNPYFNFSDNISKTLVPFLNSQMKEVRQMIKEAFETIIKEDKKEEITLKILRLINNFLKTHAHNVNVEMLQVLLSLDLRDVNLDKATENVLQEKKLNAHKSRVLQLSKKERKRKKKLQHLEKELLETKAEENRNLKKQNLTEITKIVFGIYFRILKNSQHPEILSVCLQGLAKFSHCINIEFYIDLVNILDSLLKEDWLGTREKLFCIQTVFTMLSDESLSIDPTRFYVNLYTQILGTTEKRGQFKILLDSLNQALIKRGKKITAKRMCGFVKRLSMLSLELPHHCTLATLALIKSTLQANRSLDILLDLETSFGEGQYQAMVDDPEYSNAASSALYELSLLRRHYHPVVALYAKNLANGAPSSGDHALPIVYGKCLPAKLYTDFDPSEMAFNPPVTVPRKTGPSKMKRTDFIDNSFKVYCKKILHNK